MILQNLQPLLQEIYADLENLGGISIEDARFAHTSFHKNGGFIQSAFFVYKFRAQGMFVCFSISQQAKEEGSNDDSFSDDYDQGAGWSVRVKIVRMIGKNLLQMLDPFPSHHGPLKLERLGSIDIKSNTFVYPCAHYVVSGQGEILEADIFKEIMMYVASKAPSQQESQLIAV